MKKFFTLIAVAVLAFAAQANELTVGEGLSFSNVNPICGLYADTEGCLTQTVYPATMLTDMADNNITAVTFYTLNWYYETYGGYTSDDETDFINFDGAKFQLALKEIDENGFAETVAFVGATAVATCVPEFGDTEVTFVLDAPFAYTGKSLLVEVTSIETEGDWGQTYFFGSAAETECSYYYIPGGGEDGEDAIGITKHMPMATFTYEAGTTPVVDQVGAPTFEGYSVDGITGYGVYILPTTEGSEIMYRVSIWDEENNEWTLVTDWTLYEGTEGEIYMTEMNAKYRVDAYAFIGNVQSPEVAYEFVVTPPTSINEMNAGKTVAGVRYFNMAGQEMQQAEGLTIVVTTYTDGTSSAVKVVK